MATALTDVEASRAATGTSVAQPGSRRPEGRVSRKRVGSIGTNKPSLDTGAPEPVKTPTTSTMR